MGNLNGKTIFITGASRGIGEAIALRCAKDGANIVIAAKTDVPNPKLPGTIHTVAEAVEAAGGKALPIVLDVRDVVSIEQAVKCTVDTFGGIDVLINNASAISLTRTADTPMKRFDLMQAVNARATFACSQACYPYLKQSDSAHILTLSPPLNMKPKWFKDHVAYTISKYGMSMCTLGMAEEFKEDGISVNSLWPKTPIATMAIKAHFPEYIWNGSRHPDIVADAAHCIISNNNPELTGQFLIDEQVLLASGLDNFDHYATVPGETLLTDFYLDD